MYKTSSEENNNTDQTTTDDIEARICNEPEGGQGDDTQVQLVELYIR